MFLEKILFKREKDSNWEIGYQIGKSRYDNISVFDKNMNIVSDQAGAVWDIINALDQHQVVLNINDESTENKELEEFANKNYKK